jgi:hypothetical protein
LTNNGLIQFSSGSSDVYGSVTGNGGSKLIVTGNSNATFYNAVTMTAGSEFRVSGGSTAIFLAPVTGTSFFTGSGTKDFEAGANNVAALITTGNTQVQNGAALNATVIRESSLETAGKTTIAANGGPSGTSNLGTLTIPAGGALDLKNNDLVVKNTPTGTWNGTAYTGITGLIVSGRNGGTWNGSGIVSSVASDVFTTLAVATADQAGFAGGSWSGQPVAATDTLVMFTYGGDANLDGKLNVDDYGRIDTNIGLGTRGYYNGDFNYDGKVNVDDYGILDSNIGVQGPPLLSGAPLGGNTIGVTAVPEPAAGALFIAAALSMRRRRRRMEPRR